jgi:hypothetical protein
MCVHIHDKKHAISTAVAPCVDVCAPSCHVAAPLNYANNYTLVVVNDVRTNYTATSGPDGVRLFDSPTMNNFCGISMDTSGTPTFGCQGKQTVFTMAGGNLTTGDGFALSTQTGTVTVVPAVQATSSFVILNAGEAPAHHSIHPDLPLLVMVLHRYSATLAYKCLALWMSVVMSLSALPCDMHTLCTGAAPRQCTHGS